MTLDRKRKAASIIYWTISIFTLIFSGYLIYTTYQVMEFEGQTQISGRVVDSDGNPIVNVIVQQGSHETRTDDNGYWQMENADQGEIEVIFFKRGYHVARWEWVSFPIEDKWRKIKEEGSPNNLSAGGDIELTKELTWIDVEHGKSGNYSTLTFEIDDVNKLPSSELIIEGGVFSEEITIRNGTNLIEVPTKEITISLKGGDTHFNFYHPLGANLLIEEPLKEIIEKNSSFYWDPPASKFTLILDNYTVSETVDILFEERFTNKSMVDEIEPVEGSQEVRKTFEIPPGEYNVTVFGREIRDKGITNLTLRSDENFETNLDIDESGVILENTERELWWNYIYSAFYLAVAALCVYGGFRIRKEESSWAVLLIISFLAFFTFGPFDLVIVNINQLLAVVLVLLVFYIRRESMNKRSFTSNQEPSNEER